MPSFKRIQDRIVRLLKPLESEHKLAIAKMEAIEFASVVQSTQVFVTYRSSSFSPFSTLEGLQIEEQEWEILTRLQAQTLDTADPILVAIARTLNGEDPIIGEDGENSISPFALTDQRLIEFDQPKALWVWRQVFKTRVLFRSY